MLYLEWVDVLKEGYALTEKLQIENYLSIENANVEGSISLEDDGVLKDVNLVKMGYYFSQGNDVSDIANYMGLRRDTVRQAIKSDEFKAVMNSITVEVVNVARMFLASAGITAVRTLIDCMNSSNDKVRLKAATETLDRIGITEPKKIELIAEGSAFNGMSDTQMLEMIRMGMDEITGGHKELDFVDEGEALG